MRFLAFCTRYCQVVQKRFEYIRSYSNTLLESRDDEGLRKYLVYINSPTVLSLKLTQVSPMFHFHTA